MKISELKDKTIEELNTLHKDLTEEYRNLRFQLVLGAVSNVSKQRETKRNIAKVKTLLREYELGLRENKPA